MRAVAGFPLIIDPLAPAYRDSEHRKEAWIKVTEAESRGTSFSLGYPVRFVVYTYILQQNSYVILWKEKLTQEGEQLWFWWGYPLITGIAGPSPATSGQHAKGSRSDTDPEVVNKHLKIHIGSE